MAAWNPDVKTIESSNLYALMRVKNGKTIEDIHQWSVEKPKEFWEHTVAMLGITMRTPFNAVLDDSQGAGHEKWLAGATMNIAESCFKGERGRAAIITCRHDGKMENLSLDWLDTLSNRIANGLQEVGLHKGDAVAIDMAMTAEAVAIYLGIIKMGGAVISIPDSFPPEEIAKRLKIGKAKAIFTQYDLPRAGKRLPLYEKICDAGAPKAIVLGAADKRLRDGDAAWERFLSQKDHYMPVVCSAQDVITILFSSGTTGDPKAIPWEHATPIKCASDAHYHHDVKPGDILCWPTSLGWMMGPWLIFASLINGASIALYEGGPVERGFCEFVQKAGVTMLGLVPSIAKGWRQSGCADGLDWSKVRRYSSSGEASNADDYGWLMGLNQPAGTVKPIIEYCGGTEIGGGYLTNNLLLPQNPAEFNGKTMGIDFVVMCEDNRPCAEGEMGEVYIVPPSMGLSTRLLNGDNDKVYYAGCPIIDGKTLRRHGDSLRVLAHWRFQSDGRADNTMNLGGIKTGSAEIERVVAIVPGVIETAAVGIPPKEGGPDRLVIYAVAKPGSDAAALKTSMQRAIKEKLNPLFHLYDVILVDALPRTASNKVMHKELRKAYRDKEGKAA
jgi:acetyl-CoA synthetase